MMIITKSMKTLVDMEYNPEYAKKVYAGLTKRGYTAAELGDEAKFVERMSKESNRRKLYDYVQERGNANMGSWERFNARMNEVPVVEPAPNEPTETEPLDVRGGENGYTFTAEEDKKPELSDALTDDWGKIDGARTYKKVSDQPATLRPSVAAKMSPEQIAQAEVELAKLNEAPKAEEPEKVATTEPKKKELHIDGWTGAAPKIKPQDVLLPEEFYKLTREQKLNYLNSLEENKRFPYPSDTSEEDLDTAYRLKSFGLNHASMPDSKRMQALLDEYIAESNRPGTEDRRLEIGMSPQLIALQDSVPDRMNIPRSSLWQSA